MKHDQGNRMAGTGLLLIAAALFLCVGNMRESEQAEVSAQTAARQLQAYRPGRESNSTPTQETEPLAEMTVMIVDGREYIGTLSIPALELELGILSRCSEESLKLAPGRFTGNVSSEDLVIAAHNYASHFGRLGQLQPGDEVILTDVAGTEYRYRVAEKEILPSDAVTEMTESRWPLTLFTCTVGGRERFTVRCEAAEAQ